KDSSLQNNSSLIMVQGFNRPETKEQVQSIQKIQHHKFLYIQEVFFYKNTISAIFKFMPLSLSNIVKNPIINKILDRLSYLERNGLKHQQLKCSNMLIDYIGNIKIYEGYKAIIHSSTHQHIKALSHVIIQLIQGYTKKDDVVGIDDLYHWPSNSYAIDFLLATIYISKAAKLLKHLLFQIPWHSRYIQGLISLANVWLNQGYKYPA
ncbi:hypothetical protein B0T25DRAFT_458531, partial [Lasiosphaeria hispida]